MQANAYGHLDVDLETLEQMGLIPPGFQGRIDPYTYTTPLRQVAVDGTDQFSIPINAEAAFVLTTLTGILADDAAGVIATGALDGAHNADATLEISDSSSARRMTDEAVYWHNIVGTAQRPSFLPIPKRFAANGTVNLRVADIASNGFWWQLCLVGFRVYGDRRS
jgi:hypothetical protein